MPRVPRSHQPEVPLHIIARGVEKRDIFLDDADRRFFMNCVRDAFHKYAVKLFTDVLMSNHFHLLAMATGVPIGVAMHLVQTRYAHYFNNRYERAGHLFENRFHSVPVLDLRHFVTVAAYIIENPIRAGLVSTPGAWAWSSYGEMLGGDRGLLDLDALPGLLGLEKAEFVEAFAERLATNSSRRAAMKLDQMIDEAAALCGLSPEQAASGERGAAFTYARKHVLDWGTAAGYSIEQIAEALNCSRGAMFRLSRRRVRL
jgi:REP element-mobilizing transposase RayT